MDFAEFNTATSELLDRAEKIVACLRRDLEEAAGVLRGDIPVPEGSPSREAVAFFCLGNSEIAIGEVVHSFHAIADRLVRPESKSPFEKCRNNRGLQSRLPIGSSDSDY